MSRFKAPQFTKQKQIKHDQKYQQSRHDSHCRCNVCGSPCGGQLQVEKIFSSYFRMEDIKASIKLRLRSAVCKFKMYLKIVKLCSTKIVKERQDKFKSSNVY